MKYLKNDLGMSLIEISIVLLIMGMVAAIIGPQLFGKVGQAKIKTTKAQISDFETALDMYRLDMGRYPTTSEGLKALREQPSGSSNWKGPYFKKDIPKDPWDHDYQYTSPGSHGDYDILSYGADGVIGGDKENKDITSWE
ncbi:MAG: type II secretion system major pseudopilin GspG [Nitrospirae bacterium]|nr:type II secretion system major pseudopilin GspG [Nitrospirota bacterium]